MKTVTIRCEHTTDVFQIQASESDMPCIQCGLIQIALNPSQAVMVRNHCRCMPDTLFEDPNNRSRVYITVDPSQVDLGGESISSWLIG